MFSKALNRLTFACSLALLSALALASPLSDCRDAVKAAKSEAELSQAIAAAPQEIASDAGLTAYFSYSIRDLVAMLDRDDHTTSTGHSWRDVRNALVTALDSRIAAEGTPPHGDVSYPSKTATQILSSPIYTDRQEREGRNWLDKAGDRIGQRVIAFLNSLIPNRNLNLNFGSPAAVPGLIVLAWILIGAAVAVVLYFIFRNVRLAGRRRRVGGILDDDEPDRTADQWLAQADRLEAEGKHREAVRCLYLACLVRYDDGRIARFRRHETNWEHLYRIEASPSNPREVDFRDLTQRFDKVWYGFRTKGAEDVAIFREVYQRLCQALQIKVAA